MPCDVTHICHVPHACQVYKYHGPAAERLLMQEELNTKGFDVLLTTYSYFEGDI